MRELRSEEFKERARRLEYEQEQERRLAAQDERTRIAREMHDIVAHSLSSIISQADGARYAAASARTARAQQTQQAQQAEQSGQAQQQSEPDIAEQTLELIADTARDSHPDAFPPRAAPHGRGNHLRTRAHPQRYTRPRGAEPPRRATRHLHRNHRHHDARTLPPGAELAAYRTVRRHSPTRSSTPRRGNHHHHSLG